VTKALRVAICFSEATGGCLGLDQMDAGRGAPLFPLDERWKSSLKNARRRPAWLPLLMRSNFTNMGKYFSIASNFCSSSVGDND
jgi:hypothetical protein